MAWICKKCGCDKFYQPVRSKFIIIDADKDQNITESEESGFTEYGKFHCESCNKTGWSLDKVAKWVEENE